MITAKQAKELREKAIENEIAKKRKVAIDFCEKLGFEIEKRAKEKYTLITTEVDIGIRSNIVHELINNGYKVEIHIDNTITVQW